jgi:hypothetical protein
MSVTRARDRSEGERREEEGRCYSQRLCARLICRQTVQIIWRSDNLAILQPWGVRCGAWRADQSTPASSVERQHRQLEATTSEQTGIGFFFVFIRPFAFRRTL